MIKRTYRITALILVVVMISGILLIGCSKDDEIYAEAADYEVTFEKQTFDENGCHVVLEYPVISGLADSDNEREINSRLYEYVYNKYKMKCLVSDEDDGIGYNYLTVDAAVTVSIKGYFCALICINSYSDDSSHGDYFGFTVNCNTKTGELYDSSDIIKNYEGLRKKFTDGKFQQQYGLTTLMTEFTYEDLISRYYAEYDIYPYIYFEKDKVGINIDVVHLYGGYAGFAIDISEVEEYLNTDLEFIKLLAAQ